MKTKIFLLTTIVSILSVNISAAQDTPIQVSVNFDQKLQDWDGFGVNYVQPRHTRDFDIFDQDYGGMKYLSETDRKKLIELVFGEEGLQPDIIKCFLDPFHEPFNDNEDPYVLNESGFDHEKTTKYIRYFLEEGIKLSRQRNEEPVVLAGLYGPPGWMSHQRTFRGRDLDPEMTEELAEYLVAWVKYLIEESEADVRYISMHNEGESYNRWPADGRDYPSHYGHDFNMFWTDENVVDFIISARTILDHHGLTNIGIGTGEPSTWTRLFEYSPNDAITVNYAGKINSNPKAIGSIGLITSHGFDFGGDQFDTRAIKLLRKTRPELHAWTTSCTWGDMSLEIVKQAGGYIYKAGVNGIIPWATVHNNYESDKLFPPRGFRISSNSNSPIQTNNGVLETTKAYYFFKQMSRAGRKGMKVAQVNVSDPTKISVIAWASNGTKHPNSFLIINSEDHPIRIGVSLSGISAAKFTSFYTQDYGDKNYSLFDEETVENNSIQVKIPERSVVTFFIE